MFNILFENKDYLVVEKPSGICVHPSDTSDEVTLIDQLKSKIELKDLDPVRPGVVHRLDKDTSGILIVAKNKVSYDYFVKMFKNRKIEKHYYVLVRGILKHKKAIIDSPISRDVKNRVRMNVSASIGAKNALTVYEVLHEYKTAFGNVSLLDVNIKTGRTHQIRVHMKAIDHPVVMDETYGDKQFNVAFFGEVGLKRQFLHAYFLGFKDPQGDKKIFRSDLPKDLNDIVLKLKAL
ncbi:MAG: RluA family pseudouridine synthase [Candidatus Gracilibacteria bacterium]|jgi:23S rRNA pseudouridine1911/1915/1917 synthase